MQPKKTAMGGSGDLFRARLDQIINMTPRPPRLVSGRRPWGVLTTGALQQMVHLAGLRPCSRAVIIGSDLAGRLPPRERAIAVEHGGALRFVLPQSIAPLDGADWAWHFNLRPARRVRGRLAILADGREH